MPNGRRRARLSVYRNQKMRSNSARHGLAKSRSAVRLMSTQLKRSFLVGGTSMALPLSWVACVRGLGAIVLLSLSVPGCGAPPQADKQPVPKVTVTPVVSRETTDFDEYIGRTEASEIVEVRARVFGYLKSVEFKDGDFVEKGQPLFTVEDDEYDAINKVSLSRIELAKTQH